MATAQASSPLRSNQVLYPMSGLGFPPMSGLGFPPMSGLGFPPVSDLVLRPTLG